MLRTELHTEPRVLAYNDFTAPKAGTKVSYAGLELVHRFNNATKKRGGGEREISLMQTKGGQRKREGIERIRGTVWRGGEREAGIAQQK